MPEFYEIDSTRISLREFFWWHPSPLVIIAWINKWSRFRVPISSDDPNVDETLSFLVAELPADATTLMQPAVEAVAALGYHEPYFQVIYDAGTETVVYWATFRHPSGTSFARAHLRVWHRSARANRGVFTVFFTEFLDGTFLVSSSGKPDMAAPRSVEMIRRRGLNPASLWSLHEKRAAELSPRKGVRPANSREDVLAAAERYHVLTRDFHLARRVFRHRTEAEQATLQAIAATAAQAQASGHAYPGVMAELDRMERTINVNPSIWLLILSVIVFIAVGAARWDRDYLLWIIPVLFIHEGGHWLAMRIFGYRNLRMFFIPLFGAAVMGKNRNVPGWKRAIVSLAGPLPGIAIGAVLGIIGLVAGAKWMTAGAFIFLLVNGFNLLPFLPLDGGRVLHATLFCRNRWLDGVFRIVAIGGMILLALGLHVTSLGVLGFLLAIGLPLTFKQARVADYFRKYPVPPPVPGDDRIPPATAEAIITQLKQVLPPGVNDKVLAQHTLNVFETLNTRPPGVFATLAILAAQGGGFVLALILGFTFLVSRDVGLRDVLRGAASQADNPVRCESVQQWRGSQAGQVSPDSRNFIYATFKQQAAATAAFSNALPQLPQTAAMVQIGETVIIGLPVTDDAAREKWLAGMRSRSKDAFVSSSNGPVEFNVSFVAPTKIVASNLDAELNEYFEMPAGLHLIAPWSSEARQPDYEAFRAARRQWIAVDQAIDDASSDPALDKYQTQIADAFEKGATVEVEHLADERDKLRQALEAKARDHVRNETHPGWNPALTDLNFKWADPKLTNAETRLALLREIGPKLGELRPADGSFSTNGLPRTIHGSVERQALYMELTFNHLNDPVVDCVEVINWLCEKKGSRLRYDFQDDSDSSDDGP